MAQECRSVCGVSFLPASDGHVVGRGLCGGEAGFDGVVAEAAPGPGREQRVVGGARFVRSARPAGWRWSGERDAALLAALAQAADVRAGAELDVAVAQAGQLGDPQPGLDGRRSRAWSRRPVQVAWSGAASRASASARSR